MKKMIAEIGIENLKKSIYLSILPYFMFLFIGPWPFSSGGSVFSMLTLYVVAFFIILLLCIFTNFIASLCIKQVKKSEALFLTKQILVLFITMLATEPIAELFEFGRYDSFYSKIETIEQALDCNEFKKIQEESPTWLNNDKYLDSKDDISQKLDKISLILNCG